MFTFLLNLISQKWFRKSKCFQKHNNGITCTVFTGIHYLRYITVMVPTLQGNFIYLYFLKVKELSGNFNIFWGFWQIKEMSGNCHEICITVVFPLKFSSCIFSDWSTPPILLKKTVHIVD